MFFWMGIVCIRIMMLFRNARVSMVIDVVVRLGFLLEWLRVVLSFEAVANFDNPVEYNVPLRSNKENQQFLIKQWIF